MTRDTWLDQLATSGALTRLPPDALADVLIEAGAAVAALGGSFTLPWVTDVVTAQRSAAP